MMLHIVQGKGRKDRLVTLSPELLLHLRCQYKRCRPQRWLFPSKMIAGRHMSAHTIQTAIAEARHVVNNKPVTPHTMRHHADSVIMPTSSNMISLFRTLGADSAFPDAA